MSWWFSPTYPCKKKTEMEKDVRLSGETRMCVFEDACPLSVLYSWFTPKLEELSLHLFALVVLLLT